MNNNFVPISLARSSVESEKAQRLVVHFPQNPSGKRTHDFTPYLSHGIDEVVRAFHEQIERLLQGEDKLLATSTIIGACNSSTGFLNFLSAVARSRALELSLSDIGRETVIDYLQFLRQSGLNLGGQKSRYDFVKLILVALNSRTKISIIGGFPLNPFPHSNRLAGKLKPYTSQERTQIARAVRQEVQAALLKAPGSLSNFDISCCLLAIALRTGRNETPLVEMELGCLKPHFKAGMRTLVLRKRRTNRDWVLPQKRWVEEGGAVLPGTVAIIERVIELTAPIRHLVAKEHADRLWIARSAGQKSAGKVSAFTHASFRYSMKVLSEKYGIKNDDGQKLAISTKRTRKTFVNRVFEISGQNVATTARAAGNTPTVTATSYLSPDKSSEENWRFMGETMAKDLASGRGLNVTPAGRCKDQRRGEYAPHTGALCTSYLNCFRCGSYVVTPDDLHKIFSFYNSVVAERAELGARAWGRVFANVIRSIDRDIVESGLRRGILTSAQVAAARRRAIEAPHPFWNRASPVGL